MNYAIAHLPHLLAIGMPYGSTWIIIAVVALLLFGGKKLPEVGKGLGGAIKSFKQGLKSEEDEVTQVDPQPATPVATTQVLPTAPVYKFDPVTGKPLAVATPMPPGSKFDPFTGRPLDPATTVAASQPMLERRA